MLVKKGTQAVKNKKILSLTFAMLCGGFQVVNAARFESIKNGSGRPSVEPGLPRDVEPGLPRDTDTRWSLVQRLHELDDTKLTLKFIKPAGKGSGKGTASTDVVTPPVVSPSMGIIVDRASLSPGTLAKIIGVGKGAVDFAHPDAIFLPDGTMVSRMLNGKPQKITDSFLKEIRTQMKKQRATYQRFFSRLSAKQKKQEQKSFEILNTELGRLTKLELELVRIKEYQKKASGNSLESAFDLKSKEIDKVQEGIRDLIKQMNKVTFNAAAKPVVVKPPVDEGQGNEPMEPVAPVHEGGEDEGTPLSPTGLRSVDASIQTTEVVHPTDVITSGEEPAAVPVQSGLLASDHLDETLSASPLTEEKLGEFSRSDLEALKQVDGQEILTLESELLSLQNESSTDPDHEATIEKTRELESFKANLGLVERVLGERGQEGVVAPAQSPVAENGDLLTDFDDGDGEVVFNSHTPRIVPKVSSSPVAQSMYQESILREMEPSVLNGIQKVLFQEKLGLVVKIRSGKATGADVSEEEKSLASSEATYELINKILKEQISVASSGSRPVEKQSPVASSGSRPVEKQSPAQISGAEAVGMLLKLKESNRERFLKFALGEELLLVRTELEKQLGQKPTTELFTQLSNLKNAVDKIIKSRQVLSFEGFVTLNTGYLEVEKSTNYEASKNKTFYDEILSKMNPYLGKTQEMNVNQRDILNKINVECMNLEIPVQRSLDDTKKIKNDITALVKEFTDFHLTGLTH